MKWQRNKIFICRWHCIAITADCTTGSPRTLAKSEPLNRGIADEQKRKVCDALVSPLHNDGNPRFVLIIINVIVVLGFSRIH